MWLRKLASLAVCVLIAGCGESTPPPPPNIVPVPPPSLPAAPGTPAAPASPAPSGSGNASGGTKSKIDPSVSEDRIFLVNAEEPNFDVADPSVNPNDEFAVLPGDAGGGVVVTGGTVSGRPTAKLPDGFRARPEFGATAEGWPWRIECEADDALMAYVPGGVFLQGTNSGPPEAGPAHGAYLDPYYIDVQEVTLDRFFRCRSALKEAGKPTLAEPANAGQLQDHPAAGVQWKDAVAYAKWAKKDLPTEAEWEMAGRGSKAFEYPWGNERAIWERARKPGQINPVGSYRGDVSVHGAFDMAGNVREWCADIFSPDYYAGAKERDGSAIRNPEGPRSSPQLLSRVAKGGKAGWELWHRSGESMQKSAPDIGFRCVVRLPVAAAAPAAGSP